MTIKRADSLLKWKNQRGEKISLMWVIDDSVEPQEVDRERLELCRQKSDNEWETIETVDYIKKFEDFGIPEDIL